MKLYAAFYRISRLLIVLLIGAAVMMFLVKTKPKPESTVVDNKGLLVQTISAVPRTVRFKVSANGTVQPRRQARIVAEVAGRIVEKSPGLDEGVNFQQGQVLYRIDPSDYRLEVRQLEAQLGQIRAETAQLAAELTNTQELKEWAQRDVQLARQELERMRSLLKGRTVSQEEVDRAERQAVTANSALQSTENALRLFPARAELLKARADVMQSNLDQAVLRLERTAVKAPFDGRILTKNVEIGEYVRQGDELTQLWDTSVVEVRVNLPSEDAQWVYPDESDVQVRAWLAGKLTVNGDLPSWVPRAIVRVDSGGKTHEWDAYIRGFEGRVETQTRTMPAIVQIIRKPADNGMGESIRLVPGTFCEVEIEGQPVENCFIIPTNGVNVDGTVWTVQNGRLNRKSVTILRTEKQIAYVTAVAGHDGLKTGRQKEPGPTGRDESRPLEAGDRIVVSQLALPTEGMSVRDLQSTQSVVASIIK